MKKLIILISLLSLSCSKSDDECTCNGKWSNGNGGVFYVTKQPIDCVTEQPTYNPNPQAFWVGCQ